MKNEGESGSKHRQRGTKSANRETLLLPAADEMDDFQAVSILEHGFQPAAARYDIEVQLNRHPLGFHRHLLHQSRQRKPVRKIFFFAVNSQLQKINPRFTSFASRFTFGGFQRSAS